MLLCPTIWLMLWSSWDGVKGTIDSTVFCIGVQLKVVTDGVAQVHNLSHFLEDLPTYGVEMVSWYLSADAQPILHVPCCTTWPRPLLHWHTKSYGRQQGACLRVARNDHWFQMIPCTAPAQVHGASFLVQTPPIPTTMHKWWGLVWLPQGQSHRHFTVMILLGNVNTALALDIDWGYVQS